MDDFKCIEGGLKLIDEDRVILLANGDIPRNTENDGLRRAQIAHRLKCVVIDSKNFIAQFCLRKLRNNANKKRHEREAYASKKYLCPNRHA